MDLMNEEGIDRDLVAKRRALGDQLNFMSRTRGCSQPEIPNVENFWNDSHVRATLEQEQLGPCEDSCSLGCSLFKLDHSDHFLNSSSRILQPDYVPSVKDILWSYTPTTGIHESSYIVNGIKYQFVDVGGARPERKKWIHAFHDVQTVVFTVDVSCYDRVLLEDDTANRMMETFTLWDTMVNSPKAPTKTNMVVMFMREDRLTRAKLTRSPITTIFPGMLGDSRDPENVVRYMVRHLKSMIKKKPDCDRSILFCSGGSIGQSMTDLAEITVDAIQHAAYQQQRFVKAKYEPIPRPARFKWRLH